MRRPSRRQDVNVPVIIQQARRSHGHPEMTDEGRIAIARGIVLLMLRLIRSADSTFDEDSDLLEGHWSLSEDDLNDYADRVEQMFAAALVWFDAEHPEGTSDLPGPVADWVDAIIADYVDDFDGHWRRIVTNLTDVWQYSEWGTHPRGLR